MSYFFYIVFDYFYIFVFVHLLYFFYILAKKRNVINYKTRSSDKLYNFFKKQSKNKKRIDDIREELKKLKIYYFKK